METNAVKSQRSASRTPNIILRLKAAGLSSKDIIELIKDGATVADLEEMVE